MEFVTPRLLVRPVQRSDVDAYFQMFSDPEATRYWFEPAWTQYSQAEKRVAALIERNERGPEVAWTILHSDEVIGGCSLFAINEQCRRAEIGYSIHRPLWGQGFATEAVNGLIRYAFIDRDLNRLEADIDPRNIGSAEVLKRNGFKLEGYLKERWIVNGEKADTELYGLLAADWKG